MQQTRRWLYVATMLTDATLSLAIFAVSRLLAENHAGMLVMGLVGAGQPIAWGLTGVAAGGLSDRHGRRPVALAGIVITLVAVFGCWALHAHLYGLVVCYWLTGVGGGFFYGPLIAWLGDGDSGIAAGKKRASRTLLFFCMAWNLGLLSGQLFGGLLFEVNARLPLSVAILLPLCNLLVVSRLCGTAPETTAAPPPEMPESERQLASVFAHMCWIANAGGPFCMSIVLNLFPMLAVELEIPSARHGMILAVMRVVVILTYLLMFRTTVWHYRLQGVVAARLIAVAAMLLLSTSAGEGGLMLGLALLSVMLGFNYFSSIYYSTSGASSGRRGRASGLSEATLAIGMVLGSGLGGVAGHYLGSRAPFVVALGVIVVLAVAEVTVYVRCARPLKRASAA